VISKVAQVKARVEFKVEVSFRVCSVAQVFSDGRGSSHNLVRPSLVLHVPREFDGSH
jgi:hypothetical protein